MTRDRFQFRLRTLFWIMLTVACFFTGRASMKGAIKRAVHELELQKADLAEQVASDRDRMHKLVDENLDLRHKLTATALGISLAAMRRPCVVGRVSAGSPAGKAGIAVGDVVLSINGEPLPENDGHLQEAIPRYFGHSNVDFTLRRGSQLITATVDLRSPLDRSPLENREEG